MKTTFTTKAKRFYLRKKGRENRYIYFRIIVPSANVAALNLQHDELVEVTIAKVSIGK